MNRELIKLEMSKHVWAMTEDSINGIVSFLNSDKPLSAESFHSTSDKVTSYYGEPVDGRMYSYKNGNIGVMMIDGPIIPRATWLSQASGVASIDMLSDEYKAFQADESVDEIVLLMDTPGGATTGISDFSSLIKASDKKTTAFVWMAASAGYEIASSADEIVSASSGMVGSIGVQITRTDDSGAQEKKGIKTLSLVSSQSPNKNASWETDNGLQSAQQLANDLADVFISTVAENRGKTTEEVINTFGGGAVIAAPRALKAGMIDRIEDFESFMNSKVSSEDTNQPNTLFGFSMEGKSMDNEKQVSAEERADIAKAERDRIQSIESLMENVKDSHPSVVQAARAEIDRVKYDPEMTKESASLGLVSVVSKAQNGLIEELKKDRAPATTAAEVTSTATPKNDGREIASAEYEAETNALIAAAKGAK